MRGLGQSAAYAFLFTLSYIVSGLLLIPLLQLVLPWLYGPKEIFSSLLGLHTASGLVVAPCAWMTTLLLYRLLHPGEWYFEPMRANVAGLSLVLLNWGGPMLWVADRLPKPTGWVASSVGSSGVLAIQTLSPLVIFTTVALALGWALPPWKRPAKPRSESGSQ